MKRLYLLLVLCLPLQMMAQENNAFLKFFQTFTGEEGYTTINISSELLRTMMVVVDEDEEDELAQLVNTINAVRIVICQTTNTKDYENALDKLLQQVPYTQISSINESGQKTEFYQLKQGDKILEFMMISRGRNDNTVINISGDINVEKISKLSQFGFPQADTLSIKP